MVRKLECDCNERIAIEVDSQKVFKELKDFFCEKVCAGIFTDIEVLEPYYSGYSKVQQQEIHWFATKWYKCNSCDCLWEFQYPDFPAKGFVRKFEDGTYTKKD